MSFYSRQILPRMIEWALDNADHAAQRRELLGGIGGDVLEIGFGTGLNLPHYPEAVSRVVAIDREVMLPERVEKRREQARARVELLQLDASGRLPFEGESFDNVVSTWTLCSIGNLDAALAEVKRVLRPNGSFLFLEHGRSNDRRTAKWQDRLNPLQKLIGGGCHLNRQIDRLIAHAGFDVIRCDRFLMPETPRIFGEMYKGVAKISA